MTSKYDYKNDSARLKFTHQCVDFDKDKARGTFLRLNPQQTIWMEKQRQRETEREERRIKREAEIAERLGLSLKVRQDLQSIKNKKLHRILVLRREGKSLKEIGAIYSVSRERIRQLGNQIPNWPHEVGCSRRPKLPRVNFVCPACKIQKTIPDSKNKKRFCSKRCWLSTMNHQPKKGTKAYKKYHNKRCKEYYRKYLKGNPDFIEKIRIRNKRYLLKLKRDAKDTKFRAYVHEEKHEM